MTQHKEVRGLTTQGLNIPNAINLTLSIAMLMVSIYLTNYFFESHFPEHLGGEGSICNLSQFWNCGGATFSKFSNLFGIPISFFGIIIGSLNILGTMFNSEETERTLGFIARLNALGCIALFFYSLVSLGSLCPMCTIYYILSIASLILFWKYGHFEIKPSLKVLGLALVPTLIGSFVFHQTYTSKMNRKELVNKMIIAEFEKMPIYPAPTWQSPYNLVQSTDQFEDAPIQILVFSDFQCPFCKMVANEMEEIARDFQGKINIKYYFYPLDSSCNINVKRKMHELACPAATLAACDVSKFAGIHDEIFKNQEHLSKAKLENIEKSSGLENCLNNQTAKDAVIKAIEVGSQYKLKSTPTLIINGVKVEGSLPASQMKALFNHLIAKKK